MAGQQAAIYSSYLADWKKKNPFVVEPVLIPYDAILNLRVQKDCYDVITRACKFWNDFGDVVHLSDGRVAEFGDKVWTREAAVFPSSKAWLNYKKPMTFRQYFDMW